MVTGCPLTVSYVKERFVFDMVSGFDFRGKHLMSASVEISPLDFTTGHVKCKLVLYHFQIEIFFVSKLGKISIYKCKKYHKIDTYTSAFLLMAFKFPLMK